MLEALGGRGRTSKSQGLVERLGGDCPWRGQYCLRDSLTSSTHYYLLPVSLCGVLYTCVCHLDTIYHEALTSTRQLTVPCSQTCVTVNYVNLFSLYILQNQVLSYSNTKQTNTAYPWFAVVVVVIYFLFTCVLGVDTFERSTHRVQKRLWTP